MTACTPPRTFLRSTSQGFTLIEVMITVAIIGILAAVAYPSYTDYVRKSHIQEAFSNLSAYRAKLEQYYQDNRAFAASATATTCGGAAATTLTGVPPSGQTHAMNGARVRLWRRRSHALADGL